MSKILSATILIQIIAFLLSPIITRLYSPEDFGHLAVFISFAGIFITISSLKLENAIVLTKENDDRNSLIKTNFLLSLFFAFISFLTILGFRNQIISYFKLEEIDHWIWLVPLLVFFTASYQILIQLKNSKKNFSSSAKGQIIQGLSNPVSAILLFIQKFSNYGLIYAVFIGNFLGSLFLSKDIFTKEFLNSKINFKETFQKYYRFPVFYLPHSLVNFLSANLPIFLLSPHFSNYHIGLFAMALGKVFKPINLFGNSIYQVLSKKIVDDLHDKKNIFPQIKRLLFYLISIAIIPFSILYFFAPEIFSFVFGAEWKQAGVHLQCIFPWIAMTYLVNPLSFIPNILHKQKTALFIEIVHFILRFVALLYGIQQNSFKIALSAYSIVGVIVLLFTLIWYLKLTKEKEH